MMSCDQFRAVRFVPFLFAALVLGGCQFISDVGAFLLSPFQHAQVVAAPEPALAPTEGGDATAANDTDATGADEVAAAESEEEPASVVSTLPPTGDYFETPDGELLPALSLTTLDNGIKIQDLRLGEGETCTDDSTVVVRYQGTLEDGTVFDTTRGGDPAGPWSLKQLIRGWSDGMRGMAVGGVRRIVIPPDVGYGDDDLVDPDTGEVVIPAGSTLIFTIELIELR